MWGWIVIILLIIAAKAFVIWKLGYFFILGPAVGEPPLADALNIGGILKEYVNKYQYDKQAMLKYKVIIAIRMTTWVALGIFVVMALLTKPLGFANQVEDAIMAIFKAVVGL